MLLCGFEKFDDYFVRIDILERLFLEIISSDTIKDSKIELVPKMLNLLGCNKENFLKLIKKMNYNVSLENDKYFFKYSPIRKINKKNKDKFQNDNPFAALKRVKYKMILKFFNKEEQLNNDSDLINVACLMIHAAKIDENYTDKEKKLLKKL